MCSVHVCFHVNTNVIEQQLGYTEILLLDFFMHKAVVCATHAPGNKQLIKFKITIFHTHY